MQIMTSTDSESESSQDEIHTKEHNTPKRLGEKLKADTKKRKKVKHAEKYLRPAELSTRKLKTIRDKKLRGNLINMNAKHRNAAEAAAKAEILLPSTEGYLEAEGLEKTYKITQQQIKSNVDLNTARKIFALDLPDYGPYKLHYARNGRSLLLGGQTGHLAILDTLRLSLTCEFHVNDHLRDVTFLHNNSMFAVAQKKYIYLYDNTGAEAHCIRGVPEPHQLEFLPYHFLLTCVSGNGVLSYHDVTNGKQVALHRTKQGLCNTMVQNPWNAVIHLGHASGLVTLWTPNMSEAVVKMQCHQGPIRSMAIDHSGKYLVTAGADKKVKIFDIRKYQEVTQYYVTAAAKSMSISQRGLLALGFGPNVHVIKGAFTTGLNGEHNKSLQPYMTHKLPGSAVECLKFQPFEDILTIGHAVGIQNIVIPGAGEPNFDTFEANPFENTKQRNESEVRSLLDKLRPEMITLDPTNIGQIDIDPATEQQNKIHLMIEANDGKIVTSAPVSMKNKMRGRNRPSRRLRKKQQNVIDAQKQKYREGLEEKKKNEEKQMQRKEWQKKQEEAPIALNRFFKK